MTTIIAILLDRCGLSIREAAEFLNVRDDTIKSWRSGRNPTPPKVIGELQALYLKIGVAAREALAVINQAPLDADIELGIAVDDYEAKSLGFPCVGAHAALLGLVVASSGRAMRIVPRGATPASAAAADVHDR